MPWIVRLIEWWRHSQPSERFTFTAGVVGVIIGTVLGLRVGFDRFETPLSLILPIFGGLVVGGVTYYVSSVMLFVLDVLIFARKPIAVVLGTILATIVLYGLLEQVGVIAG